MCRVCGIDTPDDEDVGDVLPARPRKQRRSSDGGADDYDAFAHHGGASASGPRLMPGRGIGLRVEFGVDVGFIRWFPWTSRFEGTCTRPGHEDVRCRFTKYATPSSGVGDAYKPALGRPLGLMSAWLLGEFDGMPHEHTDPFHIMSFSRHHRLDGRRHLSTLQDGDLLQAHERPQRSGEPEEPFEDP